MIDNSVGLILSSSQLEKFRCGKAIINKFLHCTNKEKNRNCMSRSFLHG